MKILIISDIHITKFELKKLKLLQEIIEKHDKVIINGDLWDSWHITAEEFINSKYKKLFPLLLEKETVYIFGNHDPESTITSRQISKFAVEYGNSYEFKLGETLYHLEHGHLYLNKYYNYSLPNKFYEKLVGLEIPLIYTLAEEFTRIGYKIYPKLQLNSKMMIKWNEFVKHNKPKNKFYIIGHTHKAEVDKKNKFANSGAIYYGHASYLTLEEDNIDLKKLKY